MLANVKSWLDYLAGSLFGSVMPNYESLWSPVRAFKQLFDPLR